MQRFVFLSFLFVLLHTAQCEDATFTNASDTVVALLSAAVPMTSPDLSVSSSDTTLPAAATDATFSAAADATPTSVASAKKTYYISAEVPRCSEKEANLNECIKNAFEYMLPRVKDGSQELNIPRVDPFTLNRTVYSYAYGAVNARITMKKALAYGFLNLKIKDLKFKFIGDNRFTFRAKSYIPHLNIVGDYKATGTLNNVQVKPSGTFNLTINDINIDQLSEGDFYEKDNHRFMRLDNFDVKPTIGNFTLNATGLFPDPNLNELILSFANQYWRQIYGIMLPETKQYWAPMIKNIINQAMAAIPYDLVMKDINDNKKNAPN